MTDLKFKGFVTARSDGESTGCSGRLKFSDVPLDKLPLGMSYVPMQKFGEVYSENDALERGTLFPELDKPFRGRFTGVKR